MFDVRIEDGYFDIVLTAAWQTMSFHETATEKALDQSCMGHERFWITSYSLT